MSSEQLTLKKVTDYIVNVEGDKNIFVDKVLQYLIKFYLIKIP